MEALIIDNLLPQGGWIYLADYLKAKYNWNREEQPLIIKLDDDYKFAHTIALCGEFLDITKRCNELAGIDIFYADIHFWSHPPTIPIGVIKPQLMGEVESLSDQRHVDVYDSGNPYLLKIF